MIFFQNLKPDRQSSVVDNISVISFQNKKAKFGGFLFKIANCHKDLAKAVSKSRANYIQNWIYPWILDLISQNLRHQPFFSVMTVNGLDMLQAIAIHTLPPKHLPNKWFQTVRRRWFCFQSAVFSDVLKVLP